MDFSNLQARSSTAAVAYFPLHRTQLHPRMHSSSSSSSSQSTKSPNHHKLLVLLASLLTFSSLFYLFSTAQNIHHSSKFLPPSSHFFGLVLYSSPSSSRARLYRLMPDSSVPFLIGSTAVATGISEFGHRPENAGGLVGDLVEFAKRHLPKKEWGNAAVHLMASGRGMEGLELGARNRVLESCRRVLRASGFVFKDEWARVIKEEEKGVYAWIAVNYVLGSLGGDPEKTAGVIQLGGTSLQVTVVSSAVNPIQSLKNIKLAGADYNLQTQSLPQLGQDALWESLHEQINSREIMSTSSHRNGYASNPCIPRGYFPASNVTDSKLLISHASGNFTSCRHEALILLKDKQEKCLNPPCKIVSSFSLEPQGKTVSQENLFYASELFGLVPSVSLLDLELAGQHYCEDDWDKLKNQHNDVDDLVLLRYCFSSAYIVAMAHDLGVATNYKRSGFGNHTGSFPFDWTLGAFILESMLESFQLTTTDVDQIVGNESVTYFSLFALISVIMLAAFVVLQWRKPQFKTIYDLEKGHYIVTRVPR